MTYENISSEPYAQIVTLFPNWNVYTPNWYDILVQMKIIPDVIYSQLPNYWVQLFRSGRTTKQNSYQIRHYFFSYQTQYLVLISSTLLVRWFVQQSKSKKIPCFLIFQNCFQRNPMIDWKLEWYIHIKSFMYALNTFQLFQLRTFLLFSYIMSTWRSENYLKKAPKKTIFNQLFG